MKKTEMRKTGLVLVFVVLALLLVPPAMATKGVGIRYGVENAFAEENKVTCVNYGVYNPWDEDVNIILTAGGELAQFALASESVFVPANTVSSEAIRTDICFDIPKVYERGCIEGQKVYSGEVVAKEAAQLSNVQGSGSATSVVASAPLSLNIMCIDAVSGGAVTFVGGAGGNWLYLIVGVVLVAVTVITLGVIKKRKSKAKKAAAAKQFVPQGHQPMSPDQYALQQGQQMIQTPQTGGFSGKMGFKQRLMVSKYKKLHGKLIQLHQEYKAEPYNATKKQAYTDHWQKMNALRQKMGM